LDPLHRLIVTGHRWVVAADCEHDVVAVGTLKDIVPTGLGVVLYHIGFSGHPVSPYVAHDRFHYIRTTLTPTEDKSDPVTRPRRHCDPGGR
jgi:hypothetical protein